MRGRRDGGHPPGTVMTRTRRRRLSGIGQKVQNAPRPNLIERRMSKFLRESPSVRIAASVIVVATTIVVVGGGALIRVLDHREYSNVWVGMWWALQTVTTVGYGDVTPREPIGRLVGAFVMLEGIAFLTITTAVITSTFVARAEHEQHLSRKDDVAAVEASLAELNGRFDRLESMLSDLARR
jgi:voltage-gated potassium channel